MTKSRDEARWTELVGAVQSGQQRKVLVALKGADEAERALLYPGLVALAGVDDSPLYERSEEEKQTYFALVFALAGTAPKDQLDELPIYQLWFRRTEKDGNIGFELLQQRSSAWREAWRDQMLWTRAGAISSILTAVGEGYCDAPLRPTDPDQLAQVHANVLQAAREAWGEERSLAERLAEQPWALSWPIDLIFELEGSGDGSLAAVDKYLPEHATWSTTLHSLLEGGSLDRDRMIDATLRAMGSDFAAFRAGWFQRFFRGLALTDDEALARSSSLYGLLASSAPATASTVLEGLSRLQRAGTLEPEGFVRSVGPCLLHKAKKTPLLGIKMLAAVAKAEPGMAAAVGESAALALSHPHTDVQGKALALIESLAANLSPETKERVAEAAPFLSATLTQDTAPAPSAAPFAELPPPAPLPAPAAQRLPAGEQVTPLESMDELVLEAVRHLEESHELAREERLLDGMLRMESPVVGSSVHVTLAKAAERTLKKGSGESYGSGQEASDQMALVLLTWLGLGDEEWDDLDVERHPGTKILRERRASIVRRFGSKSPERLWSLPTHSDGSIEADEAKRRWAECALPDDDPDRLILWARACIELAPTPPPVEVPAGLVTRSRGEAPYFWSWLTAVPESTVKIPMVPGALLGSPSSDPESDWRDTDSIADPLHIRSAASLCIRYPEVAMHLGARAIASNLDFSQARWANRHFLEPLLWPGLCFGRLAHLALAVGLAAKETQERAIAIDACIEAAEEGRVRAGALGAEIAGLLPTRLPKPQRWRASLSEVAAASPSHAEFVGRVLVRSLEVDAEVKPRGLVGLLELLVEVNAQTGGVSLTAAARDYLVSFKGASKAAKLAKALVAASK